MHNTTCPPNNHTRLLRAAHSRWYNRQAAGGSHLIMRRADFKLGDPGTHTHTHTSFKPDLAGKCTGEKSLCTSIRNKGSLVNVSPSPSSCHLVNGSKPKEPLWCQPTQCTPPTAQDTSGVFGGGKDYCARTELLTEFPFSPQTLPNPLSISSSWYVCLWSIYSGPVAESQFTEELNLKMDTLFREKGNPDCTVMWHASRSCHKLTKKTGFHVFNFWMTHVQVPTVLITSQAHRLV